MGLSWAFAQFCAMGLAVVIAIIGILSHRKLERQKAFLAFFTSYNSPAETDEGLSFLRGEEQKQEDESEESFNQRRDRRILFVLNQFEMLAIGIRAGIYDRKMAVKSFGPNLVYYHKKAEDFIKKIRAIRQDDPHEDDIAFKHFEDLAKEIRRNTRKPAA